MKYFPLLVESTSRVKLGGLTKNHINSYVEVKTVFWRGYKGMEVHFPKQAREIGNKGNEIQIVVSGDTFKQLFQVIIMFKAWQRSITMQ